jgi:hypothetical protein
MQWGSQFLGTGNGGVTFLSWYRQWGSHFLGTGNGGSFSWYRQWGSHFLGTCNGGVTFFVQTMGESLSWYIQWGSCCSIFSFLCSALWIIVWLFLLYSVWPLHCLSFFNLGSNYPVGIFKMLLHLSIPSVPITIKAVSTKLKM